MKLGDYITKTQVADSTDAMGAGYEREHARLRDLLYGEIPSERIAQLLARGREVARRELAATIDQLLSVHGFGHMTGQERDALVEHTLDMVLGLGPIEKMLKDDEITEIMVNGPDARWQGRRRGTGGSRPHRGARRGRGRPHTGYPEDAELPAPAHRHRVCPHAAKKTEALLMKLGDYITKTQVADSTDAMGAGYEREHARLRDLLYGEIPSERIAQLLARGREVARRELAATIDQLLSVHGFGHMTGQERDALVEHTLDMVLGLGPIEKMLKDDEITEIMVNGPDAIFFERRGSVYRSAERYDSEEQLRLVVDRIVSPLGRRVDEQSPLVNARLPEGHRVNVVIPPLSIDGTSVTIRKFRTQSFTLDELVDMDALSPEMERLLAWAVRARKNIAVSGGTGGGKTTLLNALSRLIPHAERIITIEDSAELRFDQHPHVIRLEARLANAEGRGAVTIRDLVTNALRMRPDRIIVGECRGAEALDMLQAMNTGHDGSMTTLHANSPAEAIPRLVMMVRYGMDLPTQIIREQIASALDLIVQQDRLAGGMRRITQIAMRNEGRRELDAEEGGASQGGFVPIVSWNRRNRHYEWGLVPAWVYDLPYMGIATQEEVEQWVQSVQPSCLGHS